MTNPSLIDQNLLRKVLDYDPDTGDLAWKARPPEMFPASRLSPSVRSRSWNTQFAGKPALNCIHKEGYRHGVLFRKNVKAHRVIFAWMTGEWPEQVDHINGDRADNRWANLRAAYPALNSRNTRLADSNSSGVHGVGWHKATGKWRARITLFGKQSHLGCFSSFGEAVAARKAAEEGHGFTERHGT